MQTKTVTLPLFVLAELLAAHDGEQTPFDELGLWRLLDKYAATVIQMQSFDEEPAFYAWCSGRHEEPGHYFDVYPHDADASGDTYLEAGIRAVALHLLGEGVDTTMPP